MRQLLIISSIALIILGFTTKGFRDNSVIGIWTAKTPINNLPNLHPSEFDYDTLLIKGNGKFVHYTYPALAIPHAIYGHWEIESDSLVLIPEFENYYFQKNRKNKRSRKKLNGTISEKLFIDRIGSETYLYDNQNHRHYERKN